MNPTQRARLILTTIAEPFELPQREWFSTRDISMLCDRSVFTVREWVRYRGLPASKFGARGRLYIARPDFAAWLRANEWALSRRERRLRSLAGLAGRAS